jgi:diacylglycerol kinase family enzyme
LAVIPCGTGNDFAETLGIRTLEDAQGALNSDVRRRVDVIAVDCQLDDKPIRRHALLFGGIGIAGDALRRTTPLVKRLFGQQFAYQVGLVRALCSYEANRMRVEFGGEIVETPILFVGASNSERAGGGLKLAPGARIDDGYLNINIVEALGRWEAFGQVRRLKRGLHTEHPRVRYCTATNLTVETPKPVEVAADGELIGYTPARLEIKPLALEVLVPKVSNIQSA